MQESFQAEESVRLDLNKVRESARINGLIISRVPQPTRREFKQWSEEKFDGDYGMSLCWLWDYFKGCLPIQGEELEARLQDIEAAVQELKLKADKKPEEKKIRLLDGDVLSKRGGN